MHTTSVPRAAHAAHVVRGYTELYRAGPLEDPEQLQTREERHAEHRAAFAAALAEELALLNAEEAGVLHGFRGLRGHGPGGRHGRGGHHGFGPGYGGGSGDEPPEGEGTSA